ncbi:Cullin-associated NEDD8-dissociated protein 1, partial [Mortierella sp. NVP85]
LTVSKADLETAYIIFVPSIQQLLSTASHIDHHYLGINSNLKIEVLAIQDRYDKISSEALVVRVSKADANQKVKECCILCLVLLLLRVGDELKQELTTCLPPLLENLQNGPTRSVTVKTLSQIVESSVCADAEIKVSIFKAVPDVASLLRMSNRPLKVASLYFWMFQSAVSEKFCRFRPMSINVVKPEVWHTYPIAIMHSLNQLQHPCLRVSLLFQNREQSFSTIAWCIAVLSINADNTEMTVSEYVRKIEDARSTNSLEHLLTITLGEISRRASLSGHATLHTSILAMFSVHSEEIRSAAAYEICDASAGNEGFCVFIAVQEIETDPKKRHLLLHVPTDVIARHTQKQGGQEFEAHASEIRTLLFDNCESQEESTRNVVAECLGTLTLTDPYRTSNATKFRVSSDSRNGGSTFQHTFTDNTRSYHELLRPLLSEFLSLMKPRT